MNINGTTPQAIQKKQAKLPQAESKPSAEQLPRDRVELSSSKEPSDDLKLIPRPKSFMGAGGAVDQAKRPYHAPHGDHWHPPSNESERTPEIVAQQEKLVQESLEKKSGVTFQNSEGKSVEVQVTKKVPSSDSLEPSSSTRPTSLTSSVISWARLWRGKRTLFFNGC